MPRVNGNYKFHTGEPGWRYTVPAFARVLNRYDEEKDNLLDVRDMLVKILKHSEWYQDTAAGDEEFSDLWLAVDELETAEDAQRIDELLEEIYDLADYDRAWLAEG
jgi:hypothetical protein